MIARLWGSVDTIKDSFVILNVQGVGYKVQCSQRTLETLEIAKPCTLYIETVVREDALLLYGFSSQEEQAWFTLLTTVPGVGARVALALLSFCSGHELAQAILSQNKKYLTGADGVGPKLAERLIHELKGKLSQSPLGSVYTSAAAASFPVQKAEDTILEDALSVLMNLGYRRSEVLPILEKAWAQDPSVPLDRLVPIALQMLSRPS